MPSKTATKYIKIAGLFILIAFPVLFYLFLQLFGENRYDTPIFYENGIEANHTGCEYETGPYTISDFTFFDDRNQRLTQDYLSQNITVIDFYTHNCPEIYGNGESRDSVYTFFERNDIQFLFFSLEKSTRANSNDTKVIANISNARKLKKAACAFVLAADTSDICIQEPQLVLVDKEKRIRGYFKVKSMKEIDRLKIEIAILQKNYAESKEK